MLQRFEFRLSKRLDELNTDKFRSSLNVIQEKINYSYFVRVNFHFISLNLQNIQIYWNEDTKTVAKYDEWRTTSDFARLCCNFNWMSWTRYLIIWRCRTMSNIQRHSWFTRVVPNFSRLPLRPSFFSAHVSTNYFQIFQSPKKNKFICMILHRHLKVIANSLGTNTKMAWYYLYYRFA